MFRNISFNFKGNAEKGRDVIEKIMDLAIDQTLNPKGKVSGALAPFRVDCLDTDTKYEIIAELPGYTKEEITVSYDEEHQLTISAEHAQEVEEDDVKYACRERRTGKVERMFYIDGITADHVSVSLENGILTVVLPKENPDKNKKIFDIN